MPMLTDTYTGRDASATRSNPASAGRIEPPKKAVLVALAALLLSVMFSTAARALPAFPGAEGFGTETPGGRGGTVHIVSNLNDSGPGSLRAACEAEGPRFVVFRVSGTIALKDDLKIRHPFITIAGQTAPGGGICLKDAALNIKETHDVVVRYLRCRPGDEPGKELDAITVSNAQRVVFDHVSASFGIDETLSITNATDCTVQWCFITESLNNSVHKKGAHGYGSLVTGPGPDGGQSWHHNLFAHHKSRSPRAGSNEGQPGIVLDFRNNVIYDWTFRSGYSGETATRINYIGNYLDAGPSCPPRQRPYAFWCGGPLTKIHLEGNLHRSAPDAARKDNARLVAAGSSFPAGTQLEGCIVSTPFAAPRVSTSRAEEAFEAVLQHGGASLPRRDALDARVAEQVRAGTGKVIDSQREVGGWPELAAAPAPLDTDQDGLPDAWEVEHGLDPVDPADSHLSVVPGEYTHIERYANSLK